MSKIMSMSHISYSKRIGSVENRYEVKPRALDNKNNEFDLFL